METPKIGLNTPNTVTLLADADYIDPAFDRDRFVLTHRPMSRRRGFDVRDESGEPLLHVERPAQGGRSLTVVLLALVAFVFIGFLLTKAILLFGQYLFGDPPPDWCLIGAFVIGFVVWPIVLVLALVLLSPLRDIRFYTDRTREVEVLRIRGVNRWRLLKSRYLVESPDSAPLACLVRRTFGEEFKWTADSPQDEPIMRVQVMKSPRTSLLGEIFENVTGSQNEWFVLQSQDGSRELGLLSHWERPEYLCMLDMTHDAGRLIDRRIALALAVILADSTLHFGF